MFRFSKLPLWLPNNTNNFILFDQYNESGQFNEIRPHKDENLAFNSVKKTIWECYL